MKISYSPESIKDLQRVVEFVESKNPFAARRIAINLQEAIQRLKQFPNIGLPVLNAEDPEFMRDIFVGNYTVRYLIKTEHIYILRFWHGKENEKNE